MVKVGPDTGGIGHHVGDVVLLMDAVKQVCHGALGEDSHVFPAMGLVAQRDGRLGLVVVVSCRAETSSECLPGRQCCERSTPFSLTQRAVLKALFSGEEARAQHPGEACHQRHLGSHRACLTQMTTLSAPD